MRLAWKEDFRECALQREMQNFIFEAAKKLDTAEPTVRHRVEILRKQGITTVSVDSCKIGLRITAMALMKTDAEHFKNLPRSC